MKPFASVEAAAPQRTETSTLPAAWGGVEPIIDVAVSTFAPFPGVPSKNGQQPAWKLVPVSFGEQILPGTFEHTLNELIDNEIDLTIFEARYCNDETGAPAMRAEPASARSPSALRPSSTPTNSMNLMSCRLPFS